MECELIQHLVIDAALGNLSDAERKLVAQHLKRDRCQDCAQLLAEAESVLPWLPFGLNPVAPSQALRQRLVSRLQGTKDEQQDPSASPSSSVTGIGAKPVGRLARWRGIAARAAAISLATAAITGFVAWLTGEYEQLQQERQQQVAHQALERRLDAARRVLPAPQFMFAAAVRGTDRMTSGRGHIVIDGLTRTCHVYVFDLPALLEKQSYQLWWIGKNEHWIPSSTLDAGVGGVYSALADAPADGEIILQAAITVEPHGGSAQPTGNTVLLWDKLGTGP